MRFCNTTAVCLMAGTELAFPEEIVIASRNVWSWKRDRYNTAIFRQIHTELPRVHHDALEFPDGRTVLLTTLPVGKRARVLQLPSQPQIAADPEARRRLDYASDSMPS
jgi:hypothetical protein